MWKLSVHVQQHRNNNRKQYQSERSGGAHANHTKNAGCWIFQWPAS
jgi:hypothetical protein